MKTHIKKGFTMVELLVVVAVMTILMTIILSSINKQRILTRDRVRVAGIDQIRLGIENYKLACKEYPNKLDHGTNNGCRYGEELSDFLPNIPIVPEYAAGSNLTDQSDKHMYTGMSSVTNGKCYEYHIGVQLEFEYSDPKNSEFLKNDHDFSATGTAEYKFRCAGTNPLIETDYKDASKDDQFRIYDFRSQTYK